MITGNKIVKKIEINDFLNKIKQYSKEQIECTSHALFRLNEKQRKIFTSETLKRHLIHQEPFLVGIQDNSNYAVFYKFKKNKFLKMIINIQDFQKLNIVTFYFIEQNQIPKI